MDIQIKLQSKDKIHIRKCHVPYFFVLFSKLIHTLFKESHYYLANILNNNKIKFPYHFSRIMR